MNYSRIVLSVALCLPITFTISADNNWRKTSALLVKPTLSIVLAGATGAFIGKIAGPQYKCSAILGAIVGGYIDYEISNKDTTGLGVICGLVSAVIGTVFCSHK